MESDGDVFTTSVESFATVDACVVVIGATKLKINTAAEIGNKVFSILT